jgi:hypothetical protein
MPKMNVSTATTTFTEHEIFATPLGGGRLAVAMQDTDGWVYRFDACGYTYRDGRGEWYFNCEYCRAEFQEITWRVNEALYYADDDKEALQKIAKRAGVSIALVRALGGYGAVVKRLEDIQGIYPDDRIVIADNGVEDYARVWVANALGKTWMVGTIDEAEFDPDNFDFSECQDIGYEYTWENLDDWGDSTPTDDELKACF